MANIPNYNVRIKQFNQHACIVNCDLVVVKQVGGVAKWTKATVCKTEIFP